MGQTKFKQQEASIQPNHVEKHIKCEWNKYQIKS